MRIVSTEITDPEPGSISESAPFWSRMEGPGGLREVLLGCSNEPPETGVGGRVTQIVIRHAKFHAV